VTCASCGREIKGKPVMAVYGDEEFAHKRTHPQSQVPFPLDRACFDRDRVLTVTRWKPGETELEEFETTRYVEVQG
jgi:hypothetical protein